MRNNYTRRGAVHRESSLASNHLLWVGIAVVIAIFVFVKFFFSSDTTTVNASTDFISVTPVGNTSAVSITPASGSKKTLSATDKFYTTDSLLKIEAGSATGSIRNSFIDFDESSEVTYSVATSAENQSPNDTITLKRGRLWVNSRSSNLFVKLDNLTAKIPSGSVAILEQMNVVHSVVYAISGDIEIITDVGQQTIKAGEKIVIMPSDVKNSQTKLSELVGPIDSLVETMKIFTRNDGKTLLEMAMKDAGTDEALTQTGETLSASGATQTGTTLSQSKYIAFTQPLDGATIKTTTTTIIGTLLSTDVVRVTLNDVDTAVSPVNENFTMENFKLSAGINNIVYKVYDVNNTELEKWVLVIYGPKSNATANTIVPENFPNLKDFVITAPASNPYATTESYVKVQGVVPKNSVKYITVNDYRLQKFVPNSTSWYYHANASIGTIKEWTNLYHIKFFDNNDKLIHTQIFTIIKDTKNATTTTATTTTATTNTATPTTNVTFDETPLFQ